jgi:heptaprenylglyceryl phosphate synthase
MPVKGTRGIDQCNMRESLRKIAAELTVPRVVFLSQQSNVVPQPEESLKPVDRIALPPGTRVILYQPERARQKCRFSL